MGTEFETEKSGPPANPGSKPANIDRYQDFLDVLIGNNEATIKSTQIQAEKRGAETNFDKFNAMSSVLGRYQAQKLAPDQLVGQLSRERDNLDALLNNQLDEATYARRAGNIKALEDTIAFIEDDEKYPAYIDDALAIKQAKEAAVQAQKLDELQVANRATDSESLHQTRETLGLETEDDPEKLEQELIREVLEKGGTVFTTSLPPQLRPDGKSGFTSLPDRKIKEPGSVGNSAGIVDSRLKQILGTEIPVHLRSQDPVRAAKQSARRGAIPEQVMDGEGIAEVLYSRPLTADVKETYTETEEVKMGLFRKEQKTVTRERVVGKRPTRVSEVLSYQSDEPAVNISYATNKDPNYQDYSHRAGQNLKLELILPQSLAQRVMKQASKSPEFIHQIIDQIALRDMGIPEESWRKGQEVNGGHPLRPPYEKWKSEGRKAYVVESAELDYIDKASETVDFDPKFLRSY